MGEISAQEPVDGSKPSNKSPAMPEEGTTITHQESTTSRTWLGGKWGSTKPREGDTAMALFNDPDELHEEIDPADERKILWKIDFMILPYLAVCYAFFYIDKVCFGLLGCASW